MRRVIFAILLVLMPVAALAHGSGQGLVLLLPTHVYMTVGTVVVALTIVLLALSPDRWFSGLAHLQAREERGFGVLGSVLSLSALGALLMVGLAGTRDPLENLLPLFFWAVFWMGMPVAQMVFGDVWRFINPWSGLLILFGRAQTGMTISPNLGYAIVCVQFVLVGGFSLVDIAPDDPHKLARVLASYWFFQMGMAWIFGDSWLRRAEPATVFLGLLAEVSPLNGRFPGRGLIDRAAVPVSLGVFVLVTLGLGSFDGLNETFWWLAKIGINPLEFPGRSAVVQHSAFGVLVMVIALPLVFYGLIVLGFAMARLPGAMAWVPVLALTVVPISLAYHISHYLVSFLVDGQYVLVALSDPFSRGADWLGLGEHFVSTGFLNRTDTVRVVWLTQGSAIVIGHVLAVVLSHAVSLRIEATARQRFILQVPISAFMVAYTFFGLWLLSTATGT